MKLEEIIQHYCNRIDQCLDDLEEGGKKLSGIRQMAEESWEGPAAKSFCARMEACSRYLNEIRQETEQVKYRLDGMKK